MRVERHAVEGHARACHYVCVCVCDMYIRSCQPTHDSDSNYARPFDQGTNKPSAISILPVRERVHGKGWSDSQGKPEVFSLGKLDRSDQVSEFT